MADIIAALLMFGMFLTPLLTITLLWKRSDPSLLSQVGRVLIGLLLAFLISLMMYWISISIVFRDGMGPG